MRLFAIALLSLGLSSVALAEKNPVSTPALSDGEKAKFFDVTRQMPEGAVKDAVNQFSAPGQIRFVNSLSEGQTRLIPSPPSFELLERYKEDKLKNSTSAILRLAVRENSSVLWDLGRLTSDDPSRSESTSRLVERTTVTKEALAAKRDSLVIAQFSKRPTPENEAELQRVIKEGKPDAPLPSGILDKASAALLSELPAVKKILPLPLGINEDRRGLRDHSPAPAGSGAALLIALDRLIADSRRVAPDDYVTARNEVQAYLNGLAYGHYLKAKGEALNVNTIKDYFKDYFSSTGVAPRIETGLSGLIASLGFEEAKRLFGSKADIPADLVRDAYTAVRSPGPSPFERNSASRPYTTQKKPKTTHE